MANILSFREIEDMVSIFGKFFDLPTFSVFPPQRIAHTAETVTEHIDENDDVSSVYYWNVNNITNLIVTKENSNFYNLAVNTSLSSVHVPTNVYSKCKYKTV
jgi:VWA N-terminal.